jgi:molecular chaperone HtpG
MTKNAKTQPFNAETGKILNIMINSLYSNKDIFLRELVSNASDACDKLRYEALQKSELLPDGGLKITIRPDLNKHILTITDNGIGMNEEDLINNLGTIARSGTQQFMETLTGDNKKDSNLIGQFGVGFYSAFMVADKITVLSKKFDSDKTFSWESEGQGEFTISEAYEKRRRRLP